MNLVQVKSSVLIDYIVSPASWKCRICKPAHTRRTAVSIAVAVARAESHLETEHGAEIVEQS